MIFCGIVNTALFRCWVRFVCGIDLQYISFFLLATVVNHQCYAYLKL